MSLVNHGELRDGLRGIYARSQRLLGHLAAPFGVTSTRLILLTFIAERQAVRSADLIREFTLAPRTVTEAIDAMEADGHAKRRPDPSDRRAKLVSLTTAGREVVTKSLPSRDRMGEAMFGVLSRQEQRQLAFILEKLNARLAEMEEEHENLEADVT